SAARSDANCGHPISGMCEPSPPRVDRFVSHIHADTPAFTRCFRFRIDPIWSNESTELPRPFASSVDQLLSGIRYLAMFIWCQSTRSRTHPLRCTTLAGIDLTPPRDRSISVISSGETDATCFNTHASRRMAWCDFRSRRHPACSCIRKHAVPDLHCVFGV